VVEVVEEQEVEEKRARLLEQIVQLSSLVSGKLRFFYESNSMGKLNR
jgi:hypothetical protein